MDSQARYRMSISRMTIDKLGVKLYDKVSAAIAELVANGYDADADEVTVKAPMGVMLASLSQGNISDSGYCITIIDNGHGMHPDDINQFYLKVGGERRSDPKRGDRTQKYGRKVMGRKGVGKLAPFGICNTLEIISSGGEKIKVEDKNGNLVQGYRTAHFIMKRNDILTDENESYEPEIGQYDKTIRPNSGTEIVLRDFNRRQVPEMELFSRQLAQRFGVQSKNWKIKLVDTRKTLGTKDREAVVGEFDIATMSGTKIVFDGPTTEAVDAYRKDEFTARSDAKEDVPGAEAGFIFQDGKFYPVIGWVAYAKESYRDELMAGIRIYCRGKIAAQTPVFNRKSGFTGEHSVRSYLVGELRADWLDETEDLIQTDRRDILWSDELGQKFEQWGQKIIALVGTRSREPEKKKVWDEVLETGDVMNRVHESYPGDQWEEIREKTLELAKLLGERLRPSEAKDKQYVDSLVDYSIALGPHITLDNALKQAAQEKEVAIAVMAGILRKARIAELSSYGMIAEKRVKVIEKFSELRDDNETREHALQKSIEEAPWLINPFWSPITANQSLSSLRLEFQKYYKKQTGKDINLVPFDESGKRPDFVLSADDYGLQIIEIKRPNYKLNNHDWDRVQVYIDNMNNFFEKESSNEHIIMFKEFKVTLVCDEIGLTGSQLEAFKSQKKKNILEHITWAGFLSRTKKMHKHFLEESDRQKRLAVNA